MKLAHTLLLILVLSTGCVSFSLSNESPPTSALKPSNASPFVQTLNAIAPADKSLSGFAPLIDGSDAYFARVALAKQAKTSLDIQYYIWERDKTGTALLSYVLDAAERGVRVRLLIDDMHAGENRDFFREMDRHPNIEIRLFNPVASDSEGLSKIGRGLQIAFDYQEMNRRMHNKVFIADGTFGIVGGRNVGDSYFDLDKDKSFRDFDMLAAGPVVQQLSVGFDKYWNSDFSYALYSKGEAPASKTGKEWAGIRSKNKISEDSEAQELFEQRHAPRPDELVPFTTHLLWAKAEAVYDSPEAAGDSGAKQIATDLKRWPQPKVDFIAESAYFIPPASLLKKMDEFSKNGIKVRILTNSLRSNDVLLAHAGYAAKRKEVLGTGAELHEWRNAYSKDKTATGIYASRASLHTKSFVIDHEYVFVGSMNLDPRSIKLNTEGGIMIHSHEIATAVAAFIEDGMDEKTSWNVTLVCPKRMKGACPQQDKVLNWTGDTDGKTLTFSDEPETAAWKDVLVKMMGRLPIENSL